VLAMVAALDGDRALNDVHYIKALEHAEMGHDVVQTIRIRSNRGSHFLEEGEFDSALAELDIALRLADMTGFELWRAMALGNRGQVYLYRGRLEEALADLVEARSTFRRIGSLLEAYPVATIAEVYAVRGDTAQARALYTEAMSLAEGQGDLQALIPAQTGLSRLLAPTEPAAAIELATRATKTDFVIGRAQALVAAGWAHLHAGDQTRGRELAEEAAGVARSRHDMTGLAEALELQAATGGSGPALALLEEARSIWDDLEVPISKGRVELAMAELIGGKDGATRALTAAESLHRHGAKGLALRARAAAETMASKETEELSIRTLGGFEVRVDGRTVDPSAWQSRVAREIVWMLIAARSRPINREVLMDRIWPDDDPAKASNRLSVALTTIRKVFDPAKTHDASYYLRTDRDTVVLATDRIDIDVEAFLAEAARGRALLSQGSRGEGLTILKGAEERYVGEFLEEHPYADWAVALREEARSEYMTIASDLARASEEDGDYELAARRYLRMLERDVYNEPAHISLVRVMELSGRRGTARRLYGNYVARMAELDVEPEPFPMSRDPELHS
ncbi:MAG: BTAD domain-containing putative transcriptional regulator, partial [Acidimicrobiia bacterium]